MNCINVLKYFRFEGCQDPIHSSSYTEKIRGHTSNGFKTIKCPNRPRSWVINGPETIQKMFGCLPVLGVNDVSIGALLADID